MKQTSKANIAYEYIKNGIIEKRFFPGTSIIEDEIVEATGVSRTSVRKAITELQYEGILEKKSTRGNIVAIHSIDDIMATFKIRELLEVSAFTEAIKMIDSSTIVRMKKYNSELERISENFNIVKFVKINKAFHLEIANATKNKYYIKYLNEIYDSISIYLLFYNNVIDDKRSIEYHKKIVDAIISQNFEQGKSAIIADNRAGIEDSDWSNI